MVVIVAFSTFVCLGKYKKTFFFFHFLDFFFYLVHFNIHFVLIGWKLLIEFALYQFRILPFLVSMKSHIVSQDAWDVAYDIWSSVLLKKKKKKLQGQSLWIWNSVLYPRTCVQSNWGDHGSMTPFPSFLILKLEQRQTDKGLDAQIHLDTCYIF